MSSDADFYRRRWIAIAAAWAIATALVITWAAISGHTGTVHDPKATTPAGDRGMLPTPITVTAAPTTTSTTLPGPKPTRWPPTTNSTTTTTAPDSGPLRAHFEKVGRGRAKLRLTEGSCRDGEWTYQRVLVDRLESGDGEVMPEVCADDDVMPIMVEAECDGQTQIYGGRGCILYRDIDWPAGWWQIATKQCGYYHSVGETMPDGCFGRPR